LRAYKVLIDGQSPFTRSGWTVPRAGEPGAWVEVSGPVALCANGIHACTADQLPHWLGPELWLIELGGEILEAADVLVASRARLLAPVSAWDQSARMAFARDCAARTRELLGDRADEDGHLASIERRVATGQAAIAGYWAAAVAAEHASGERSGRAYDAAFAAERSVQARWLRSELGLDA
jgi:hypothetical protein